MKVFVQMPIDTPFKPGDIVLERGFKIDNVDGENATHTDIDKLFLRPVNADDTTAADCDILRVKEIAANLRRLAGDLERL